MDWKYKMYINDIYWKGYGGYPTQLQKEVERNSFKRSKFYSCGNVEIIII